MALATFTQIKTMTAMGHAEISHHLTATGESETDGLVDNCNYLTRVNINGTDIITTPLRKLKTLPGLIGAHTRRGSAASAQPGRTIATRRSSAQDPSRPISRATT